MTILDLLDEGPIPYTDAWERQKEMVTRRQRGEIGDTLLLLEHPPTVTCGRRADLAANLRLTPDAYRERGIALVETDRGGDVTYHGPGQLVGYPILHLGEGSRDVHRYVRRVEGAVIATAEALGVAGAGRADWHAGVWVGDGYLAALGVKVSRWVTHHGWALNVDERVRAGFDTIVPCGMAGKRVTTLEELLGRRVALRAAADAAAEQFVRAFAPGGAA
jgi:lipoyl(octanoyl) transferase